MGIIVIRPAYKLIYVRTVHTRISRLPRDLSKSITRAHSAWPQILVYARNPDNPTMARSDFEQITFFNLQFFEIYRVQRQWIVRLFEQPFRAIASTCCVLYSYGYQRQGELIGQSTTDFDRFVTNGIQLFNDVRIRQLETGITVRIARLYCPAGLIEQFAMRVLFDLCKWYHRVFREQLQQIFGAVHAPCQAGCLHSAR